MEWCRRFSDLELKRFDELMFGLSRFGGFVCIERSGASREVGWTMIV